MPEKPMLVFSLKCLRSVPSLEHSGLNEGYTASAHPVVPFHMCPDFGERKLCGRYRERAEPREGYPLTFDWLRCREEVASGEGRNPPGLIPA